MSWCMEEIFTLNPNHVGRSSRCTGPPDNERRHGGPEVYGRFSHRARARGGFSWSRPSRCMNDSRKTCTMVFRGPHVAAVGERMSKKRRSRMPITTEVELLQELGVAKLLEVVKHPEAEARLIQLAPDLSPELVALVLRAVPELAQAFNSLIGSIENVGKSLE